MGNLSLNYLYGDIILTLHCSYKPPGVFAGVKENSKDNYETLKVYLADSIPLAHTYYPFGSRILDCTGRNVCLLATASWSGENTAATFR